MTFKERSIQTVRDFCYKMNLKSTLTEEDTNMLRTMIEKAFEDQHEASMKNLSEFMAERFK